MSGNTQKDLVRGDFAPPPPPPAFLSVIVSVVCWDTTAEIRLLTRRKTFQ